MLIVRRPTKRSLAGVIVLTASWLAKADKTARASEAECAAIVAGANGLVLVTTDGMDTPSGRLQLFVRDSGSGAWHIVSGSEPVVVGRAGIAWGFPFRSLSRPGEAIKVEGDGRTPAGFYRIGRSFGSAALARPQDLTLKPGQTICINDPSSPGYNTLVTVGVGEKHPGGEDMGAEPLYRRGLIIDYPSNAEARAGSCIFLHVWRGPGRGTNGCIALPEDRVAALQVFAAVAGVIAILPKQVLDRFSTCLPHAE